MAWEADSYYDAGYQDGYAAAIRQALEDILVELETGEWDNWDIIYSAIRTRLEKLKAFGEC